MYFNLITVQCNKILTELLKTSYSQEKKLNAIINLFFHYEYNIIIYGSTNTGTTT